MLFRSDDIIKLENTKIPYIDFPAINIGKSVTKTEFQNTGINSIMRLQVFNILLYSKFQAITGIVYDNAPRVQTMRQLGYEFHEIQKKKGTNLEIFEKRYLVYLSKEKLNHAIVLLENRLLGQIKEYNWIDDFSKVKLLN